MQGMDAQGGLRVNYILVYWRMIGEGRGSNRLKTGSVGEIKCLRLVALLLKEGVYKKLELFVRRNSFNLVWSTLLVSEERVVISAVILRWREVGVK